MKKLILFSIIAIFGLTSFGQNLSVSNSSTVSDTTWLKPGMQITYASKYGFHQKTIEHIYVVIEPRIDTQHPLLNVPTGIWVKHMNKCLFVFTDGEAQYGEFIEVTGAGWGKSTASN